MKVRVSHTNIGHKDYVIDEHEATSIKDNDDKVLTLFTGGVTVHYPWSRINWIRVER